MYLPSLGTLYVLHVSCIYNCCPCHCQNIGYTAPAELSKNNSRDKCVTTQLQLWHGVWNSNCTDTLTAAVLTTWLAFCIGSRRKSVSQLWVYVVRSAVVSDSTDRVLYVSKMNSFVDLDKMECRGKNGV
jgi:hypothetical protein